MLLRRRSTSSGTGLRALFAAALLLVLTGPLASARAASPDEPQPYQFLRGAAKLARIDTASGQVATVGINGDGGWKPLDSTPSADGISNHVGRYGLLRLPPHSAGVRGGRSATLEPVLRFDRATGRAWIAEITQPSAWREIGSDAPIEGPPADSPSSQTGTGVDSQHLPVVSKEVLDRAGGLSKEDIEVFVQAIQKPGIEPEVKIWAVLQLGVVDPDLSVPPLLDALESDDPQIVVAAVQSLTQTGVPSVVPHILKLEDHPDPAVRAAVAAAVKRVD
jgi:hypothetical protein